MNALVALTRTRSEKK